MQSASRGGFGQCLPAKGGVAAAHQPKKCGLLCHGRRLLTTLQCYTATLNYPELHCKDELGTDHRHTAPLLTTDGKSAKTVFPQKHTATKWAQPRLPYVCVRRTWQYRHRTGKDIKHVLYVPAMPYVHCSVHSTAVHGLDIKHRKTENSQRKFHGGPHLSLGLHVISKLCHICWKPPFKPTNICEENAT